MIGWKPRTEHETLLALLIAVIAAASIAIAALAVFG